MNTRTPGTCASFGRRLGHDLIDRPRTFGARLQVDADAALIRRARAAPSAAALARAAAVAGDVGILRENRRHFLLMADHFIEADALDRFDADVETALILSRQEPLRHDDEQIRGAGYEQKRKRHRDRTMPQRELQRHVVGSQGAVEHALR